MAIDEIEELGASLLQRQRTTRKRKQKRYDKDKRNAMWLQVAGQGVSLANNYLRERATNFINNNEDLMGQRLTYLKQLQNKERIIDEYGQAIAHPTGVEGWLAEKKFAPIILANFQRDYPTRGSSKRDLDNLVLEQAREEAKIHKDNFEKTYEAALQMGDIDDYDAYIRSRDGRAENVGGFLFNSLSRMFNDRTQADIDQEMIKSIRKNRFGKNATQVAHFDSLIKDGVSARDAIDLTYEGTRTLEDWGIEKEESILKSMTPVQREFIYFNNEYTVDLMRYDYVNPNTDELVESVLGRGKVRLSSGEIVESGNTELFNLWAGQQEDQTSIANPDKTSLDFGAFARRMIEAKEWRMNPIPTETAKISDADQYGRSATDYTYEYTNQRGDQVHTIKRRVFDQPITPTLKEAKIDGDLVASQGDLILNQTIDTMIPGSDKTAAQVDILLLHLFGSKDVMEEKEKAGVNIGAALDAHRSAIARTSAVWAQDIMEKYPGIDFYRARQLAAQGTLVPMVLSYNADEESVITQENYINFRDNPAINLLLAESMLSTGSTGARGPDTNWRGITQQTMYAVAMDAYNELKNIAEVPGETNYYKKAAARWLRDVKGFKEIEVPANVFDKDPEEGALNPDGTEQVNPLTWLIQRGYKPQKRNETDQDAEGFFTFDELIRAAMGEPPSSIEAARIGATRDAAGTSFVDPGTLSLSNIISSLPRPSNVTDEERREKGQKILEFLNRKTYGPVHARPDATRPDVSIVSEQDWQAVISKLSPEQQEEYKDFLEAGDLQPGRGSSSRVRRAEGGPSDKKKIIDLAVEDMFEDDTLASKFIKYNEGFLPAPKWDNRQWTWGYGTEAPLPRDKNVEVPPDLNITREKAHGDLLGYLDKEIVNNLNNYSERHNYNWNNNQIDALTSFLTNLGYSTIHQLTDNGTRSNEEIAEKIPEYDKERNEAGELEVVEGLTKRRIRERTYFEGNIN
jgi:GH24 family phage-related lysozyme (muramidase)